MCDFSSHLALILLSPYVNLLRCVSEVPRVTLLLSPSGQRLPPRAPSSGPQVSRIHVSQLLLLLTTKL